MVTVKTMKPISRKQDDASALSGKTMAQIAGTNGKKWISNRNSNGDSKSKKGRGAKLSFKGRMAALAHRLVSSRRKGFLG
jgi:hypothetical protein